MPVALTTMRNELRPGSMAITERYLFAFNDWRGIYGFEPLYHTAPITTPHVWVPKLTIPQAIIVGAAAAVIKNPEITRRFWVGWKL